MQLSVNVRNAMLDAVETAIGASPKLLIKAGTTTLVSIPLPSDWLANATGGSKALTGTWPQTNATGAGTADSFEVQDSNNTVHIKGTAGMSNEELVLVNSNIASGQPVQVTQFTLSAGNLMS